MANPTDAQLAAAEARGRGQLATVPRAKSAHTDPAGRIVVELYNGCAYAFPAHHIQDLRHATADQLRTVEIDGAGFNLHWPALDVDLYVPALIAGIFGTRDWMTRELASIAGRATTPSKAAAARANGAKGGRPRKTAAG